MKYIKIFEDLSSEYNIGDHVILYKKEAWRIWRIFNVVKIIDKNYYDKKYNNNFKYKVEAIEEDDKKEKKPKKSKDIVKLNESRTVDFE